MKKVIYGIALGIFFIHLSEIKAGILSEDILRYRTLNQAERHVLKSPKTRVDILKRICYIETHLFYMRTPAKNTDDKLLREVAENFNTYWNLTFNDLLWRIPITDDDEIYVVNGHQPKALVLFWIIRKRIDSSFDSLTPAMRSSILNFSTYHKIILDITNKALTTLKRIDDDPTYSELPDDVKLKEAYHRLEDEKNFLDYPRYIVQLMGK